MSKNSSLMLQKKFKMPQKVNELIKLLIMIPNYCLCIELNFTEHLIVLCHYLKMMHAR